MVPGILQAAGDIPQIAALLAPRKLAIVNGVAGGGGLLEQPEMDAHYAYTHAVYTLLEVPTRLICESYGPLP